MAKLELRDSGGVLELRNFMSHTVIIDYDEKWS
jgi:hypothetical protein